MKRFLGYWGPQNCEILFFPRPSKPKQLLFFKEKKKEKTPKERDPPQRSQGHTDSLSHLRGTRPDNEPDDPAT